MDQEYATNKDEFQDLSIFLVYVCEIKKFKTSFEQYI